MNLPALNEQYGGAQGKQYWDERYATEFAQADTRFDWFKNYSDIAHLFDKFIPSKESRILMLGCGNSSNSQFSQRLHSPLIDALSTLARHVRRWVYEYRQRRLLSSLSRPNEGRE